MHLRVQVLEHGKGLDLPAYATPGSAGLDLRAAVEKPLWIKPGERVLLPTGLAMAIPAGYEGQVRPRSGLALKHGLTMLNSPGTIDSDYRGEIKLIVINHGQEAFEVKRGERLAQLVIASALQAELIISDNLDETSRSSGGFGHSGTN